MEIRLANDFHNTEIVMNATAVPGEANHGQLTPDQVKEAKESLCGVEGCECSMDLGIRGPQSAGLWTDMSFNGSVDCWLNEDTTNTEEGE